MVSVLGVIVTTMCIVGLGALLLAWCAACMGARKEEARERAILARWNRDHSDHVPPPSWAPRRNDPESEL